MAASAFSAASTEVLAQTRAVLDEITQNPEAWESAMGQALQSNNKALAVVLLNARSSEASGSDAALEQLIQSTACLGMP